MRLVCGALLVTLVVFVLVLAGAVNNDWIMLVVLVPAVLTPVPTLLLRCCGGDDGFGSTPKFLHWAEFWSGFFFTGTIALPVMLYTTHLVSVVSMVLALSGILLALIGGGVGVWLAARDSSDAFSFQAW